MCLVATLRHHLLEAANDIRTIHEQLGHRDLSTTMANRLVRGQGRPESPLDQRGPRVGRRARYPAKAAGVLALSRPAYPASTPWQIPRQVPLAIGLPTQLNQAVCRATLQPSFRYRDTELSRLVRRTQEQCIRIEPALGGAWAGRRTALPLPLHLCKS
jgi:hypothetical protein